MSIELRDLRPAQVTPVPLLELVRPHALSGLETVPADLCVTGISVDSQDIAPGEVFVGIAGAKAHGASFVQGAIALGAVAVITDGAGLPYCQGLSIAVIEVDNPRSLAGQFAGEIYGHPARKLKTVAITGTNGKTTTSFLLRQALESTGSPCALIGTVEISTGRRKVAAVHTTTEGPVLQRVLALALEDGAGSAIIEVSSHGIELNRIAGLEVDVAVFTNLQHDHLDFHSNMENYFAAKAKLFTDKYCRQAVICVDDKWGQRLTELTQVPWQSVCAYGAHSQADWLVHGVEVDQKHAASRFYMRSHAGREVAAQCPLIGVVNIQNSAVALVAAQACGVDMEQAAAAIAQTPQVPGRMQIVGQRGPDTPLVIVDYAHTAQALGWALGAARELTPGRIALVFGSDGDRDHSKRPDLGEVGAAGADTLWLTDENPRSEDPEEIRAQVRAGIARIRPDLADVIEVTTCRRDALRQAILKADIRDTVLVTGKGVEPFQEVQSVYHRYNDVDVAGEVLQARVRRGAGTAK